jgi:hypothetical protein
MLRCGARYLPHTSLQGTGEIIDSLARLKYHWKGRLVDVAPSKTGGVQIPHPLQKWSQDKDQTSDSLITTFGNTDAPHLGKSESWAFALACSTATCQSFAKSPIPMLCLTVSWRARTNSRGVIHSCNGKVPHINLALEGRTSIAAFQYHIRPVGGGTERSGTADAVALQSQERQRRSLSCIIAHVQGNRAQVPKQRFCADTQ